MITLREVFQVTWDITEVAITAYDPDNLFIHEWQFGDKINITRHMDYDIEEGRLTIIDKHINVHGEAARGGMAEIAWGIKEKLFPKDLIDAQIWHMSMSPFPECEGGGTRVSVSVNMQRLTAETILKREEAQNG